MCSVPSMCSRRSRTAPAASPLPQQHRPAAGAGRWSGSGPRSGGRSARSGRSSAPGPRSSRSTSRGDPAASARPMWKRMSERRYSSKSSAVAPSAPPAPRGARAARRWPARRRAGPRRSRSRPGSRGPPRPPRRASSPGPPASGGCSATKVPPARPRRETRWPLWVSVVSAWRRVEREIAQFARQLALRRQPAARAPAGRAGSRCRAARPSPRRWSAAAPARTPPPGRFPLRPAHLLLAALTAQTVASTPFRWEFPALSADNSHRKLGARRGRRAPAPRRSRCCRARRPGRGGGGGRAARRRRRGAGPAARRSRRRRPRRPGRRRAPSIRSQCSSAWARDSSTYQPQGIATTTSGSRPGQLPPADLGRLQPRRPGDVLAAGDRDHLRDPVAADEGRVEPLERDHPRRGRAVDGGAHGRQPALELAAQLVRLRLRSRSPRRAGSRPRASRRGCSGPAGGRGVGSAAARRPRARPRRRRRRRRRPPG